MVHQKRQKRRRKAMYGRESAEIATGSYNMHLKIFRASEMVLIFLTGARNYNEDDATINNQ
jgi:hypothetical protein